MEYQNALVRRNLKNYPIPPSQHLPLFQAAVIPFPEPPEENEHQGREESTAEHSKSTFPFLPSGNAVEREEKELKGSIQAGITGDPPLAGMGLNNSAAP